MLCQSTNCLGLRRSLSAHANFSPKSTTVGFFLPPPLGRRAIVTRNAESAAEKNTSAAFFCHTPAHTPSSAPCALAKEKKTQKKKRKVLGFAVRAVNDFNKHRQKLTDRSVLFSLRSLFAYTYSLSPHLFSGFVLRLLFSFLFVFFACLFGLQQLQNFGYFGRRRRSSFVVRRQPIETLPAIKRILVLYIDFFV